MDLGKRGKGETWRSGRRVVYSQNVQCKRKIKRKKFTRSLGPLLSSKIYNY